MQEIVDYSKMEIVIQSFPFWKILFDAEREFIIFKYSLQLGTNSNGIVWAGPLGKAIAEVVFKTGTLYQLICEKERKKFIEWNGKRHANHNPSK